MSHRRWTCGIHCVQTRNHANKGSTLALKPVAYITRSSKQGYQWPQKEDLCPSKNSYWGKLIILSKTIRSSQTLITSLVRNQFGTIDLCVCLSNNNWQVVDTMWCVEGLNIDYRFIGLCFSVDCFFPEFYFVASCLRWVVDGALCDWFFLFTASLLFSLCNHISGF